MIYIKWDKNIGELSHKSTWNPLWKCSALQLFACREDTGEESCIFTFTPLMPPLETAVIPLDGLEKGRKYTLALREVQAENNWTLPKTERKGASYFVYAYQADIFWHASFKKDWALVRVFVYGDKLPAQLLFVETKAGTVPFPAAENDCWGTAAMWVKAEGKRLQIVCREGLEPQRLYALSEFKKRERYTG